MLLSSAARELSIEIPVEKRTAAIKNISEKPKILFIKPPEGYFWEKRPFSPDLQKSLVASQ
jgi:hypothetical protein